MHGPVLFMQQQIDRICADCSYISAQYFVTKEKCDDQPGVTCESDCQSLYGLADPCNLSPILRPPLPSMILLGQRDNVLANKTGPGDCLSLYRG